MAEIAEAVGGKLISGEAGATVSGVSKDSREAGASDLFFALVGEKHDAHSFIPQAVEAGCRSFVVSDPGAAPAGMNVVLAEDTAKALRDLARHYIRGFGIKKIGVTGSTGKTTTKEMIYHICKERFKTAKSATNMNNEIGLPISVLNMEEGTEVGIFEMGMYTPGEIDMLADIVRPDIGVITNIGDAHIQNFENREGIRDAKLEITNYMGPGEVLAVNTDGGCLTEESASGPYRLVKVGRTGRNDFIISGVESEGESGLTFFLEHGDDMVKFFMPILGSHNAGNAALAVAAAHSLGISLEEAAERLSSFTISGRLAGKDGMKIIDDTYNASPDSMRAALDMLDSVKGIRKIAILGDMNELGRRSAEYHRKVGAYAAKKKIGMLVAVGEKAAGIAEGAAEYVAKAGGSDGAGSAAGAGSAGTAAGAHPAGAGEAEGAGGMKILSFATKDEAWAAISSMLAAGDVILVKGSRGMAMEVLVKRILK
jgi:UDP-N-acetylmuramoyl-tripeptide--D-alanyl-D-alanine ligase